MRPFPKIIFSYSIDIIRQNYGSTAERPVVEDAGFQDIGAKYKLYI